MLEVVLFFGQRDMLKLPKPTRRATEKECNRNIEKAFNKLSNLLKCLILVHRFRGLCHL